MFIIPWIIISAICFIVIKSLALFINGRKYTFGTEMRESSFSLEIFYTLLVTYIIVIVGFGLIYFILSFEQIILVENGEPKEVSVLASMTNSMYFSGATMLTIGYGDVTPVGIGRMIAVVEALIGYILPTAFVLRLVQNTRDRIRDR
ncbi:two pore domain potassium channel family protein [Ornithinibacillus sp. L9]|uniref:Two pore domain potassium channel family protein n=1 Tax=Ornithinibacillus caprae TaxID=2678566 RepID=A0A6N8FFI1_9BACI|nr:potassium channel family protein [Ornithinibacillus caprae]MUK88320.1 two pore domain potassium channel family protein [Ornithinibacillus caprae]